MGHSLRAIKALYAAAQEPRESIRRLVAVSPPRLSHSFFKEGLESARYFETLSTAQDMVEAGREGELFLAGYPFPLYITAAGYIDKYGPEERYNYFKFAERIGVPVLFTYGERELEGSAAFAGIVEEVSRMAAEKEAWRVVTIPRADHNYTAQHGALGEAVVEWLER
jgi:pimeloyl-ACP methyl ester carboxylesterase